jgi:hypothetical protein
VPVKNFYVSAVFRTFASHWVLLFLLFSFILDLIDIILGLIAESPFIIEVIEVWSIVLAGIFGLIAALRLSLASKRPHRIWGVNSFGNLFIGIGLLSYGINNLMNQALPGVLYTILLITSFLFFVGLYIEYRIYQKKSYM